jgi:hypothetical protein
MKLNQLKTSMSLATAMGSLALTAVTANAAITQTDATNSSKTFYDANVSTDDLINVGSSTLGSFTSSDTSTWGGGPTGVHDGSSAFNGGLALWFQSTPVTLTYTLAGSATGYDITSINTIYGWQDGAQRYTSQEYDVLISTVSTPAFTVLTSVDYALSHNNEASSQVTLTDTTGVLASGVTGIRFITSPTSTSAEVGIIHEYDVFGTATVVPEPTTTALLGLGGLALILRRRK